MTTATSSKEYLAQNFCLIWFDSTIDETAEPYRSSITQLKSLVNTISIFTDIDQCIDVLTNAVSETIFLIVSNDYIQSIVSLIHDISQLNAIFVISET